MMMMVVITVRVIITITVIIVGLKISAVGKRVLSFCQNFVIQNVA
jgi:hypothetical protein